MSEVPSIKGTVFSHCVEKLLKLISAGKTSWDELPHHLEPEDIEILQGPIHATQWYDIRIYERILLLNRDVSGDGSNELLLRWGAKSAERLIEAGIYQQLDYAKRAERVESRNSLVRQSKLIATVTNSLYNFLEIDVRVANDVLEIVYANATLLSEALRYTTEGTMNEINRWQGASRRWASERVAPDQVRFRMDLPEWLRGDD